VRASHRVGWSAGGQGNPGTLANARHKSCRQIAVFVCLCTGVCIGAKSTDFCFGSPLPTKATYLASLKKEFLFGHIHISFIYTV